MIEGVASAVVLAGTYTGNLACVDIIIGGYLASGSWKAPSLPQVATKAITQFLPRETFSAFCAVSDNANVPLTESSSVHYQVPIYTRPHAGR